MSYPAWVEGVGKYDYYQHLISYTEELWYNETVFLWMTIFIYIYIYMIHQTDITDSLNTFSRHPHKSAISLGKSSTRHSVTVQSWWRKVFCWSTNIGVSICRSSQENITCDFFPTSPEVPSISSFREAWLNITSVFKKCLLTELPCWQGLKEES